MKTHDFFKVAVRRFTATTPENPFTHKAVKPYIEWLPARGHELSDGTFINTVGAFPITEKQYWELFRQLYL